MISVYSDGSSGGRSNKPGGYGWVIVQDDKPLLAGYGGSVSTTNNLMELEGAIQGLEAAYREGYHLRDAVELVSDSQYVLGLADGRYNPTTNLESAARVKAALRAVRGRTRWVKGHSGDRWNERCDSLAGKGKAEHKLKAENESPQQTPQDGSA